jgi:hypothetical protein
MVRSSSTPLDTTPIILQDNAMYNTSGTLTSKTGLCATIPYAFTIDVDALRASSHYDATNDYMTTSGDAWAIAYYITNPAGASTSGGNKQVVLDALGGVVTWNSSVVGSVGGISSPRRNSKILNSGNSLAFGFSLFMASVDDSYAYWKNSFVMPIGVRDGDIIFAGRNTQYYGKRNIND